MIIDKENENKTNEYSNHTSALLLKDKKAPQIMLA